MVEIIMHMFHPVSSSSLRYSNHDYVVYVVLSVTLIAILCSNLPDMMEYVSKTQQQSFQKRRPAPIQMPQPTIQQVSF